MTTSQASIMRQTLRAMLIRAFRESGNRSAQLRCEGALQIACYSGVITWPQYFKLVEELSERSR